MLSSRNARQNVNENVKRWGQAIEDAQTLLTKAENRAARLRGAIKTFEELRDCGGEFTGPCSVAEVELATR